MVQNQKSDPRTERKSRIRTAFTSQFHILDVRPNEIYTHLDQQILNIKTESLLSSSDTKHCRKFAHITNLVEGDAGKLPNIC